MMSIKFFLLLILISFSFHLFSEETKPKSKKEQVLDFSAGVIEGELNRPSMLMELGSNYKNFSDLVLLREDFNTYQEIDSVNRFNYVDENL